VRQRGEDLEQRRSRGSSAVEPVDGVSPLSGGPILPCHFVVLFSGEVKVTRELLDMLVPLNENLRFGWLLLQQTICIRLLPLELPHPRFLIF
jgi:hypothetical protein